MRDVTPDDLLPPAGHGAVWPVLGAVALAIAIAFAVWGFVPSRTRASAPAERLAPTTARARYLARIDTIEAEFRRGELGARDVHLSLSAAMRRFAVDRGVDGVTAMVPAQIREAGAAPVADAVASNYPAQFRHRAGDEVDASLSAARGLADRW